MKKFAFGLSAVLLLASCGKKGEGEATAGSDPAAPAPKPVKAELQKQFQAVDQKIQNQQYDDAVAALVQAREAVRTEEEQRAFRQQLLEAQQALQEKAETDAKARESYQALGRIMMGR